ncbi:MAG: PfkB family carbohydrate kinase [Candidatus Omnitrophica bacterium]|nr:PfkB family carbohydrate kinase [Candidatus Omnitrophota bacterium]MCM8827717.1 PfkB family carbohydrate kinase [Candidatus Omnitrophota bacterium]
MRHKKFISVNLNPCLDVNYYAEEIKFDDVVRIKKKKIEAGGKGFNVARFLIQYGENIKTIGIAGGLNGIRFKKLLTESRISTEYLLDISAETRESHNFFLKTAQY